MREMNPACNSFCPGIVNDYFEKKRRDAQLWRLMSQMPELEMGINHHPPGLWSVPLPSSVHLAAGETPPWHVKPPITRPWLMSYTGSMEGTPEAQRLRRFLVSKCRAYGEPVCKVSSQPCPPPLATVSRSYARRSATA